MKNAGSSPTTIDGDSASASVLEGRRLAAIRSAAAGGECRELRLLRAAGGNPDSLSRLDHTARMEALKALGFSKLGVKHAIISALQKHAEDPDEIISFCPGSRWRVEHNLLVLCVPASADRETSAVVPSSITDGESTKTKGELLFGELYFRGWLKLSLVHHPGGGWVKRYHKPFGQLVRAEGPTEVPPCTGAAAAVDELTRADSLGEAERRELRQMLLPATAPGADLSAGLDGSRWLLLQPTLGLCNRLRATVSAVNLCRRTRRVLLLQWHPSKACGAAFLDLFSPPTAKDDLRLWPLAAPPPRQSTFVDSAGDTFAAAMDVLSTDASDGRRAGPAHLLGVLADALHGLAEPARARHCTAEVRAVLDTLESARCVALCTCADFYPTTGMVGGANAIRPGTAEAWRVRSEALQSTFQPSASVLSQLPPAFAAAAAEDASSSRAVAADIVGVHVRRTDNLSARRCSPLAGFVLEMRAIAEKSPHGPPKFFLATDDADGMTAAELRAIFGKDRVLMRPATTGSPAAAEEARSTPAGMQAALAELLALSRCREIIGSFYSSFSVWAAVWHTRPLHIVEAPSLSELGAW